MAIVKMKKLTFSVYDTIREQVLTELQKTGCFHLETVQGETPESEGEEAGVETLLFPVGADSRSPETLASELEDVIDFLTEHQPPVKMSLVDKLAQSKPAATIRQMREEFERFDINQMITDIHDIEKQYKDADAKLQALLKEKNDLIQWESSGLDLDILNGKTDFLAAATGYVALADAAAFAERASRISTYMEIIEAFSTPKETFFYILFLRSEYDEIEDRLKEAGFSFTAVSQRTGTVREAIAQIDKEIAALSFRREFERLLVGGLLTHLDTLKAAYDYVKILQTRAEAQNMGAKTEKVSFYTGWIPAKRTDDIRRMLNKFHEIDFQIEDPKENEMDEVPVDFEVKRVFKPFEFLSRMYGTPQYTSVDPTAHLSPFYFIFYGFCLGDFFYGLILFVAFGVLARLTRKNPETSQFMSLFSLSGISAMIFGVIFKSFFSDLFTNPGYLYVPFIAKIGLIDMIKSPMLVLYIALILGAVHLLYGLLVNFVNDLKADPVDSIFSNLPWIIFLTGFFGWGIFIWLAGLAGIPALPKSLQNVVNYLLIGGAALIIVNSLRTGKKTVGGFIASFFGGLYKLYGTTAYISDLLSYARLLALGLSSSVIGGVFNYLAFMIYDGVPVKVFGAIAAGILLIVGHVFNLVLSAFGAFVHSLRLQFVEFFSKFLKSGGKDYQPLKEEGVYHEVRTEQS